MRAAATRARVRRVHLGRGHAAVAVGIHLVEHLACPGRVLGGGDHAVLVGVHHLHLVLAGLGAECERQAADGDRNRRMPCK